ncbi:MAG: site-specific DNA-methyltransferase [Corynebacterium sp.]|nr:site-specific DNA-methyltransferase [Corynebacterium sp.]
MLTYTPCFPTKLVEPCILASTKPSDIVLDPFFGSGTVGEVAATLGRDFIGIELNEEYVQLALERLHQRIPPEQHARIEVI